MQVKLSNVTVKYADKIILDDLTYTFAENKITCILGRSGAGKTTLLNAVAKLIPTEGITTAETAYMFQTPCLIPAVNVFTNVELVLFNSIKDASDRRNTVSTMLAEVGLKGYEKRMPYTLSGGEKQRVSMARAFVFPSEVLLMDEPFQSLDVVLCNRMLQLLAQLNRKSPKTVLYVTHSPEEALQIADNIAVLRNGKLYDVACFEDNERPRDLSSLSSSVRSEIYGALMKD